MGKKLCAALLCLLLLAGLLGCGQKEEPVEEEIFTEAITKIDLSAPESEKYRDWLEAYSASNSWEPEVVEPSSTQPKPDKPDMNASNEEWIFLVKGEGPAEESWKTWEWNDTWELEAYTYDRGGAAWYVLRTRNKTTGETQLISEVAADIAGGYSNSFELIHIDETYIVYIFGDEYDGWTPCFYAPGLDQGQRIDQGSSPSGFLNAERTKWWYRDYVVLADNVEVDWPSEMNYMALDEEEYAYWWRLSFDSVLYYIDLKKLAAGDADARREITRGADQCTNAWMAERGGRSVVCFYVMTGYPNSKERDWGEPYYIGIYDILDDEIKEYLEVPNLNWFETAVVLPNRIYSFRRVYTPYTEQGESILDFDNIDFYVINLDI